MNGREGSITAGGPSVDCPDLTMTADMKGMKREYMGGFKTSTGPECTLSWAVPIPILNEGMRRRIGRPDRKIPLPVMNVADMYLVGTSDYGEVWDDVSITVRVHPESCEGCEKCDAEQACPTEAIDFRKGVPAIDRSRCFNCGLCSTRCRDNVFEADLGKVNFKFDGMKMTVPVVCRQSDKARAIKLAKELKERILEGSFEIAPMVEEVHRPSAH